MMKIRAFRKGDEEVYVKVYNEGYSTEDWYGTLAKALKIEDFSKLHYDATYFAQVKNKIVGLVDIKIRDDLADIENIVVIPKYRRRGVGKALLEKAMEFSTSRNVKGMRAEVPEVGATKFYAENGFRHVTNAYLIKVEDGSILKPYLCRDVYLVENTKYWIPDETRMNMIRGLEGRLRVVGKFNVMIKQLIIEGKP